MPGTEQVANKGLLVECFSLYVHPNAFNSGRKAQREKDITVIFNSLYTEG